jgi:hypothetical protein
MSLWTGTAININMLTQDATTRIIRNKKLRVPRRG